MTTHDYTQWSNEQLIERVTKLEQQLKQQTSRLTAALPKHSSPPNQPKKKKQQTERYFDPSRYHTRFIALKLAYLGQTYNGFEHHNNNTTPLPTIEEELWKALNKTKLIFPTNYKEGEIDWEGCDYSKCGRTDRGVSAFGQVIGIRVRSARPKREKKAIVDGLDGAADVVEGADEHLEQAEDPSWHHINSELPYPRILNRVLPTTIRILAWCPSPPSSPSPNDPNSPFSARFSCRERRYRYFFTQPCYTPAPGNNGLRRRRIDGRVARDGWLNIEAMQAAAKYYEGAHDFRNFCKLDPGKQIENFERVMFKSSIEEADTEGGLPSFLSKSEFGPHLSAGGGAFEKPKVYCFKLHGSAFLWHQVRHMVAVLYLVGQGLEHPTIVRDMLDISKTPTKPMYEMADDAPLVLWDCIFPELNRTEDASRAADRAVVDVRKIGGHEDSLEWVYVDEPKQALEPQSGKAKFEGNGDGRFGPGGLQDVLWAEWRRNKINEVLAGSLLDVVARQTSRNVNSSRKQLNSTNHHEEVQDHESNSAQTAQVPSFETYSAKLFDGGNTARLKGEYVPVLERPRQESIEVQNRKYAERKGLDLKNKKDTDAEDDE